MIPGTDSPVDSGTRPQIKLKWDVFDLAMIAVGCRGTRERAELFDFDEKTIRNLKAGGPVGERSVATILTVLAPYEAVLDEAGVVVSFDGLFEVTGSTKRDAA